MSDRVIKKCSKFSDTNACRSSNNAEMVTEIEFWWGVVGTVHVGMILVLRCELLQLINFAMVLLLRFDVSKKFLVIHDYFVLVVASFFFLKGEPRLLYFHTQKYFVYIRCDPVHACWRLWETTHVDRDEFW